MTPNVGDCVRVRIEFAPPARGALTLSATVVRVSEKAAYVRLRSPDGQLLHRWVPHRQLVEDTHAR